MLRFLVGVAGTGKTTMLIDRMHQALSGGGHAIFLVPEQFSFEAERMLYRRLGPQISLRVEVLSFTRLCNSVFRRFGGLAGTPVTRTAKYLLMSVAVDELRETLEVYRKSASNTSFLETLVDACSELKTAGISPGRLAEFAAACEQGQLHDKTRELASLYGAFQGLLSRGYTDPDDDLVRACEALENNNFFGEYHVYVDGFTTFMAAEFELLGHVISQAKEVTFAMTADAASDRQGGMGVFSPVQTAIRRLSRMAEASGADLEDPVLLAESRRYQNKELICISRELFRPAAAERNDRLQHVRLYPAADFYDEIERIAVTIAGLVREQGYRYREIAVVVRDTQPYLRAVETAFGRYEIPYFADMTQDVENQPLAGALLSAVEAVRSNFEAQSVLELAKSPVMGMEAENVAALENYCYCWGVRGAVWREEFANNPRGLTESVTEEDMALLERINGVRQAVIGPLLSLRDSLSSGSGRQFAAGLYQFLQEIGAAAHLTAYAQGLPQGERESFLDNNAQLWDILMDILDVFGTILGSIAMSKKRLCELFRLALDAAELGEVPQTLDQVLVGQADRIRPGPVRTVFVAGANEGIFPRQAVGGGLFSDGERRQLIDAGLEIAAPVLQQTVLEKFFAYFALTLPSEELYVSYPRCDFQGRELLPSAIVSGLQALFPHLEADEPLQGMETVAGRTSAFSLLAREYRQDTPLAASLLAYFGEKDQSETMNRLERAAWKRPHGLADPMVAKGLFGSRLRLSPSRVERFYQCPFSYFAAEGLGLRKRRKVEFTPLESGGVIHHVLQVMVQRHGGKGLSLLTDKELRGEVRGVIREYLTRRVEDPEALPARFRYLFNRLVQMLANLLRHLGEEFAQSEFAPAAFELPIRVQEGVEPLRLETADGVPVIVEGVVDRVDVMNKNGRRYVRVVDYKSGQKEFSLHDVLYGLNMQMLLYLFTIQENGKGPLEDCIPAGVLYMPVRERYVSAGREEDAQAQRLRQWRMSGLLLEDEECLRGMERELGGIFIPAKLDKQGKPDRFSSLASRAQLGKLSQKVQGLMADMAQALVNGRVGACPVESADYQPCAYCDYKTLCGFEQGDPVREIARVDREQVLKRLEEEE